MNSPTTVQARSPVAAAMLAAAVMIVLQVGGKATRDALYLSEFGADKLPQAMGEAAVLAIVGAVVMGQLLSRFGPRRVVPVAYWLNAAIFGLDYYWLGQSPRSAALGLYLHMGALGPLLISGFWSLVNESFSPHIAKLNIGKIAGYAALGGILGGVLAERVASNWSLSAMLPILAGVSCLGAVSTTLLGRSGKKKKESRGDSTAPEPRRQSLPYLRQLAALVLLTSLGSGVLDFALKAEIAQATDSAEQMASFFAGFHAVVGSLTFVIQTTLSSRVLRRFGIGGTLAILPACIFVSGVLSSAVMRLWSILLVKGLDATLRSSVYRASYELLYTPLAPSQKRATKTLIDVGSDRAGDIAAAAAISLGVFLFPQAGTQGALIIATVTALACLGLAVRLHQGYIRELTVSLRSGTVSASDISAEDATTQRTLSDTTMALDREELLREIRELQKKKENPIAPRELSNEQRQLLQRIEQLICGETDAVQALLARPDLESGLLPWLLPLLADPMLRKAARAALQSLGPQHLGQLLDALLDDRLALSVRIQIPRVLEQFTDLRVRDGLLLALGDTMFSVRYRAARSLLRMIQRDSSLATTGETIYRLVRRETAMSPDAWTAPIAGSDSQDSLRPEGPQVAPARLRHVITLLSCHLEHEPLQLCLGAFAHGGETLQETAHEYLENVLPSAVYRELCPHLAVPKPHQRTRRARAQIVLALSQSTVENREP